MNNNNNNINNYDGDNYDDDYYIDDDDEGSNNNNSNSNSNSNNSSNNNNMFEGHQLSEAVLNLDSDLSSACTGNETMTQTEYIEYRRSNLRVALYNYEKYHLQNEII